MSSKVALKERKEIASGTTAFYFEKPKGFLFDAGQAIDLILPPSAVPEPKGNVHAFSIASAPQEQALMIATRMRDSGFKNALAILPVGSEVEVDGPFGTLTLPESGERPIVLIAGGIGITPFRSMVFRKEGTPYRIFLFYSNRHPEEAAFLDEFQEHESHNPNFTLVATVTQPEGSQRPWSGTVGRIGPELLQKHLGNVIRPVYYTAGPPGLVRAMQKMLKEMGTKNEDVRAEEFSGY